MVRTQTNPSTAAKVPVAKTPSSIKVQAADAAKREHVANMTKKAKHKMRCREKKKEEKTYAW